MGSARFLPEYLAPVVVLVACSDPGGLLCPDADFPAIEVEVHGVQEPPPEFFTAEGWIVDGAFVDSLRVMGRTGDEPGAPYILSAAEGRPGTYDVQIQKAGYAPWGQEGVRAVEGRCGVVTVRLTAELVQAQ